MVPDTGYTTHTRRGRNCLIARAPCSASQQTCGKRKKHATVPSFCAHTRTHTKNNINPTLTRRRSCAVDRLRENTHTHAHALARKKAIQYSFVCCLVALAHARRRHSSRSLGTDAGATGAGGRRWSPIGRRVAKKYK